MIQGSIPRQKDTFKLLDRIESGEIDIRQVARYALDKGLLSKEEYGLMDTTDIKRWIVINKIEYDEK